MLHNRPKSELFPYESHFVDVDGCKIHYIDEGSGPTLLMLHSAPAWSFMYRNFVAAFKGRFRCVALDFPGFGYSGASDRFGFSLPEFSAVLSGFITKLGLKKITMLIHDSSGPIGLSVAEGDPSLFAGLIITDTFAWPLQEYPMVARMLQLVSSPPVRFLTAHFNLMARISVSRGPVGRKLTDSEKRAYFDAVPDPQSRLRVLDVFAELVKDRAFLASVERDLPKLAKLPALVIFGERDPIRKMGFQERLVESFPTSESVVIAGEAHYPHEGAPEGMISAIELWATRSQIIHSAHEPKLS